ncbi:Pentatricopeptide repeat-containing protein [Spatholobus suberectus]|nr:Pentatricopeptide repeat-containing protein [Spatholobus suberectus]
MPQLKQIQAHIFCVGLQQDRDTLNKLMAFSMDSSLGDFNYANRIFNFIHDPSLFVYNLMIKAFVKRGSFRSAISLFQQLRENGVWPDNYTYPYVLKGIGCIGEVREGEKVHAFVVKTGLEFDPYTQQISSSVPLWHYNTEPGVFSLDSDFQTISILCQAVRRILHLNVSTSTFTLLGVSDQNNGIPILLPERVFTV